MKVNELFPFKGEFVQLHRTTGWNAKCLYHYDQLHLGISNSWASASIYDNQ